MKIELGRIYDAPPPGASKRILVDRLWPRGVRGADAPFDLWLKEIAPTAELRRWYNHDPARWEEFRWRYFTELDAKPGLVAELRAHARASGVILLFAARDTERNHAVALRDYLEREEARGGGRAGA